MTALDEQVRDALASGLSERAAAEHLGVPRNQVRAAKARLANQPAQPPPSEPTTVELAPAQPVALVAEPAQWSPVGEKLAAQWREVAAHPVERPTTEPPTPADQPPARTRLWPLVAIGLAAAVAVWSGWVGLGGMTGFGVIAPLPGIWDEFKLNTAVTLPISVEAYAAFALRVWLVGTYSVRTTRYAKRSALGSLAVGAGAQVAFHLLEAAGYEAAPWLVTMLVSCVPVGVLALAASLAHLVRQDGAR